MIPERSAWLRAHGERALQSITGAAAEVLAEADHIAVIGVEEDGAIAGPGFEPRAPKWASTFPEPIALRPGERAAFYGIVADLGGPDDEAPFEAVRMTVVTPPAPDNGRSVGRTGGAHPPVRWVTEAPSTRWIRATARARPQLPELVRAWTADGGELLALIYDHPAGIFASVGGPRGIMRALEDSPAARGGPNCTPIRDALERVFMQTHPTIRYPGKPGTRCLAEGMATVVAWPSPDPETGLELVAFFLDPRAAR
jgi:hypothetical protein